MKQKNNKIYVAVILLFNIYNFIIDNNYSLVYNDNNIFISYSIGSAYSCYINSKYKMRCFGLNDKKQLGLGDSADNKGDNKNEMGPNLAFVDPGTIDNAMFKSIYCGKSHTCSILTNDKAKCWGRNDLGQLGIGSSNTGNIGNTGDALPFIDFGTTDNLKPILFAVGQYHTCTFFDNKKVKCFGKGGDGALGYENQNNFGSLSSDMGNNLPFVNFGTNINVSSIHSNGGADHTCITIDGSQEMKCWGRNHYSQLGYSDQNNRGDAADTMGDKLPTLNLGSESKVLQIGVGEGHTCAILVKDNELKCWGSNLFGILGLGTEIKPIPTSSPLYVAVKVDSDTTKKVKYVSAGYDHTCVLLDDDVSAKCVGNNGGGQLGQGDNIHRGELSTNTMDTYPAISLGTGTLKINSINAGQWYTCVVFEDSTVKCFGNGFSGRLGSGSPSPIGTSFLQMGGKLNFVDIFTTFAPTKSPTLNPTSTPSFNPTKNPTLNPTKSPTFNPTKSPTKSPTNNPTNNPVKVPSKNPTISPSLSPTMNPSINPTKSPTLSPTKSPTMNPTKSPTFNPTKSPTKSPTFNPTKSPTKSPTFNPTKSPVLGCQYTNKKKCKKDNNCMWRSVASGGVCVMVDCTAFERKNCKLHEDICNWKNKSCFPRE